MRGEILSYDDVSGTGLISGDDSTRYGFARAAVQAGATIRPGARVDFVPEGLEATQIMVLANDPAAAFGQAASSSYVATDTGGGYDFKTALFSFNGRLRRQHFWISWLILLGVGVVTGLIPFVNIIAPIIMIWPNVAVYVKRLHDLGKSGWLAVIPWAATVIGTVMIIATVGMSVFTNPEAFETEDPTVIMSMVGGMMGGLAVIFLVNIAFLLWIGIADSQRGDNKYGPNPKGE